MKGNCWNECIIDSGADKTQQPRSIDGERYRKSVFIPLLLSPSQPFRSMEHKRRREIKVSFSSPFIIKMVDEYIIIFGFVEALGDEMKVTEVLLSILIQITFLYFTLI